MSIKFLPAFQNHLLDDLYSKFLMKVPITNGWVWIWSGQLVIAIVSLSFLFYSLFVKYIIRFSYNTKTLVPGQHPITLGCPSSIDVKFVWIWRLQFENVVVQSVLSINQLLQVTFLMVYKEKYLTRVVGSWILWFSYR